MRRDLSLTLTLAAAAALAACAGEAPLEPTAYAAPAFAPGPTMGVIEPATASVPAAPTPVCANAASFVEDLTLPDGAVVSPGERLDKRWAVRNSGSCDWGPGYRLVRLDRGELVGGELLALYPARAGQIAVWQVELLAPEQPGEYLASWQARAPDGEFFGDPVFVLVEVQR
jgi:hypothetical protein